MLALFSFNRLLVQSQFDGLTFVQRNNCVIDDLEIFPIDWQLSFLSSVVAVTNAIASNLPH